VSLLISVGLSWPQGQAIRNWDLFLMAKRARQQNADLSPVVHTACTKSSGFPFSLFAGFLKCHLQWGFVSDFASTPFALKQQLNIPPLPLASRDLC
jgi:hypothetical protein